MHWLTKTTDGTLVLEEQAVHNTRECECDLPVIRREDELRKVIDKIPKAILRRARDGVPWKDLRRGCYYEDRVAELVDRASLLVDSIRYSGSTVSFEAGKYRAGRKKVFMHFDKEYESFTKKERRLGYDPDRMMDIYDKALHHIFSRRDRRG